MSEIHSYRLALIGFGAVGQGLAHLIPNLNERLITRYGIALTIVAVANRKATLYDPRGLNPHDLLHTARTTGDLRQLPGLQPWGALDMIDHVEADVLVEISATNLSSGEPATSHIRAAIARHMHVVTANKGPIALHGRELLRLAHEAGVGLGYEGTVMSGTPALRLGWGALAGCELAQIRGIVNGTTNYMLTHMEGGLSYAEALAEAQRLGYAEADPSGDVEGYDAAGKAVILANMLMDADLRPNDVDRQGISGMTPADIAAAQAAGERWKLIAHVTRDGDYVRASVRPTRLPLNHPLASVGGATNAITFTTDLLGDVTLIGPGAGGVATAFALLSDILALRRLP